MVVKEKEKHKFFLFLHFLRIDLFAVSFSFVFSLCSANVVLFWC